MRSHRLMSLLLGLVVALGMTTGAAAHQPFFEELDYTLAQPRVIADPSISTALYAMLDNPDDVDYFTFEGRKGQQVLVRMDIPQLPGLEQFAPSIALLGPGLPAEKLPKKVAFPPGAGVQILAPPEGKPATFYEPFSRTSYWTRQVERITLPADGEYWLAVYHPKGETGRYVLSVGEKEVPGGDPRFREKLRQFFHPSTKR